MKRIVLTLLVCICIQSAIAQKNTPVVIATYNIRYGTGSPPANGAALTGTIAGPTGTYLLSGSADLTCPFSHTAIITGLTLSTTYWIDLSLAVASGTATITNPGISVFEIK